MLLLDKTKYQIFKTACYCRAFEEKTFEQVQKSFLKLPVYLSAGQEFIPSTLAWFLKENGVEDYQIFIQHRGHSTYLASVKKQVAQTVWGDRHLYRAGKQIYLVMMV